MQVRVWADGTHIKAATDFNAQKEDSLQIYNLNPLIRYKLRVYGYSRGGEGTMSSPAVEFSLGKGSGKISTTGTSIILKFGLTFILCLIIDWKNFWYLIGK